MKTNTIAVIGLWHLGCVTAACLAEVFENVIGYDIDTKKVDALKQGKAPIFEPGLNNLLENGVSTGNLTFTSKISEIAKAEYIWITIDTPIDENDKCDLSSLINLMHAFSTENVSHKYIVSSQVPVGSCENLVNIIPLEKKPKIAYVPENLQLGKAISRFKTPDMLVVGADDINYANEISELLSPFCEHPIKCNIRTSEFAKHAINCLLATSISFSNELSELAIEMKADAYKVVEILKQDKRVGNLPLYPGPWFSGGTLARDIRSLQSIGKKVNGNTRLLDAVIEINVNRIDSLIGRIEKFIPIENSCIAILGLVYTEGTDTLRRSPGLQVIDYLKHYNVNIHVFEPMIDGGLITDNRIKVFDSSIKAIEDVDAVIILRAGCVKDINVSKIAQVMKGRIVLDIWAVFSDDQIKATDLIYIKPGCES